VNLLERLPSDLQIQFEKIQNFLKDYTDRAYLVGGSVRDMVMNHIVKDLDIEVYDIDEEFFDVLMKKLGAKGVGKSFFVYKYSDIDISLPRTEKKSGTGHRAFDVQICQKESLASKRRDFTMNSMMLNIFSYELLDFYGGLESIKNRTITIIDKDSFKEDSLRVLRAVQFSSRFAFKIDKNSLKIMSDISLADLSKTRIFWEFEKIFKSKYLYFGLYYLLKLDILDKVSTCRAQRELFLKCALELGRGQRAFEEDIYPYYFLYISSNILKFDAIALLKNIDAPKHYLTALKNQPYFERYISNSELKIIAIDTPICKWLGNYKKGIRSRAKKLDIWDKVFDGGIEVSNVIADGYKKQEIKKELRRRKIFVAMQDCKL